MGAETGLSRDVWSRAVREHFEGLRLTESDTAPSRLRLRQLGSYGRIVRVSGGRQALLRKPGKDALAGSFKILLQLAGSARIHCRGDSLGLGGGQFALLDGREAFTLECEPGFEQLVFQLPRDWLERRLPELRRASARTSGTGRADTLCAEWLRQLAAAASELPRGTEAELAEAMVSALRLSDTLRLTADVGPALLSRAHKVLAACYHDPEFGVDELARALRVSRRALEKAFASSGTTPRRALYERRAEGAAQELSGAGAQRATLLEVAMRHGFTSAAHFSRSFSARFGVSPSEFRARWRGAVAD